MRAKSSSLASKINKVSKYTGVYTQEITKKAENEGAWAGAAVGFLLAPIFWPAQAVNLISNQIQNAAGSFGDVKGTLKRMVELVDLQEKDGFGPYYKDFTDFKNAAIIVMENIDGIVKPPADPNDQAQINSYKDFIKNGNVVLSKLQPCLDAFNKQRTQSSAVGEFINWTGLGPSGEVTRWNAFKMYKNRVEKPLSDLIAATSKNVAQAAQIANAQPAQPAQPAQAGQTPATPAAGGVKSQTPPKF